MTRSACPANRSPCPSSAPMASRCTTASTATTACPCSCCRMDSEPNSPCGTRRFLPAHVRSACCATTRGDTVHRRLPSQPFSLEHLGRDVLALLDHAGVARAHFCGLSMGGMIGMWLGIHAPDRLESLVLANTAARIGPPTMWNERIDVVNTTGMTAISDAAVARWFTPDFIASASGHGRRSEGCDGAHVGSRLCAVLCGGPRHRSARGDRSGYDAGAGDQRRARCRDAAG